MSAAAGTAAFSGTPRRLAVAGGRAEAATGTADAAGARAPAGAAAGRAVTVVVVVAGCATGLGDPTVAVALQPGTPAEAGGGRDVATEAPGGAAASGAGAVGAAASTWRSDLTGSEAAAATDAAAEAATGGSIDLAATSDGASVTGAAVVARSIGVALAGCGVAADFGMSNRIPSAARMNRTGVPHSSVPGIAQSDTLACLGKRFIDGDTAGERLVEVAAEFDRCVVCDLVLHRHDCGRPPPDQRAGGAREHVDRVTAGAVTGIEDRQPERIVIAEEPPQICRRNRLGCPFFVGHHDHALAPDLVEPAMTHEMEDVPWAPPERLLEIARVPPSIHTTSTRPCRSQRTQAVSSRWRSRVTSNSGMSEGS